MDDQNLSIEIPLKHPLFHKCEENFFKEDVQFYLGKKMNDPPWIVGGESIKEIVNSWQTLRPKLTEQILMKRSTKLPDMKVAISLLLKYIFWSNQTPVQLDHSLSALKQLQMKPLNVTDRLGFILDRPTSFQAFKQLEELMIEQQKTLARFQAIERNKMKMQGEKSP